MASNSTQLLNDIGTVITNGPSTTTKANAIAQGGPIMDYVGNCKLVQQKFVEAAILLDAVITDTDGTDATNLGLLNGVKALLRHTASPSTVALADMNTVYTNGPNAATKAKAISQTGPIMDYLGNVKTVHRKLQEAALLIGFNSQASGAPKALLANTAVGDDSTNRNLLLGMSQVLL